jgi:hypothetical protein
MSACSKSPPDRLTHCVICHESPASFPIIGNPRQHHIQQADCSPAAMSVQVVHRSIGGAPAPRRCCRFADPWNLQQQAVASGCSPSCVMMSSAESIGTPARMSVASWRSRGHGFGGQAVRGVGARLPGGRDRRRKRYGRSLRCWRAPADNPAPVLPIPDHWKRYCFWRLPVRAIALLGRCRQNFVERGVTCHTLSSLRAADRSGSSARPRGDVQRAAVGQMMRRMAY